MYGDQWLVLNYRAEKIYSRNTGGTKITNNTAKCREM